MADAGASVVNEKDDENEEKMKLQSELTMLRKVHWKLFNKEKSQAQRLHKLSREVDRLTKENEEMRMKILSKENSSLKEISKDEKTEVEELPQNDKLEQENRWLKLNDQLKEKENEIASLRKRMLDMDHEIAEKTDEIGRLKTKLDTLWSAYKEEDSQKHRSENVSAGEVDSQLKENEAAQSTSSEDILKDQNTEVKELAPNADRREQENRRLNDQPEKKVYKLTSSLNSAILKKNPDDSEKTEEKTQLDTLWEAYIDSAGKRGPCENEWSGSPGANDRELKTEVDILKKDNGAKKEGRKTFSKETSSLEEIPKDENTEIKELTKTVERLEEENRQLNNQLEENEGEITSLIGHILEKDNENEKNMKTIDQLESDFIMLKMVHLELYHKEKSQTRKLQNLLGYEDRLARDNEEMSKKIEELSKENMSLKENYDNELDELKDEVYRRAEENKELKKRIGILTKERKSLEEDLKRQQAQLNNEITCRSHQDGMVQKLRREISYLTERNKALENKVTWLNAENKKIETYHEEAVKALEANDEKVRVMRDTLEKYKADSEKAMDKLRASDEKIAKLKSELESNEENLAQALECKADTEKLKDDLRKSTERIALQKYEKEQVRKELDVERYEHGMTKIRAQESLRKNQMLNFELNEVRRSLEIARNVFDEKETNKKSIEQSLEAEKKQKVKLEKELEIMSLLQEKQEYLDKENRRLECELKKKELVLKETQINQEQSECKRQELQKENERLKSQLTEAERKITSQRNRISQMAQQTEDTERLASRLDELRLHFWNLWHSFQNERERWRQWAENVRRGSISACAATRRRPSKGYQGDGMGLSSRRLMDRAELPRPNQSYINRRHTTARRNCRSEWDTGYTSSPETSPRPPSARPSDRLRHSRSRSSPGARTQLPSITPNCDCEGVLHWLYHSDGGHLTEIHGVTGYDADGEAPASCPFRDGDRVIIKSQISGEIITKGTVRYVDTGAQGSTLLMALKLD